MNPDVLNTPTTSTSKSASKMRVLFLGFGALVLLTVGFVTGNLLSGDRISSSSSVKTDDSSKQSQDEVGTSPTPLPTLTQTVVGDWGRTDYMGAYSFEYPKGWHVADRWPENHDQGILVMMDPRPISGAPRDGSPAKIYFTDRNGFADATSELTKKRTEFKGNYADVQEETITANGVTIYHLTGKFEGEYMPGALVNEYMFIVEGFDRINDRLITLSSFNDPSTDDLLDHVARSFKKVQN